ncbi:MAG: EutN/CcmL family microcompartment protein [Chthoniobacteraceae bacterium]|nr:EutN/CcmL family microcompartment protein [Chthoniobacteraceae bacterium]
MRTAIIHGYATATVKHPSFRGAGLLIAVPESPDTPPQIVIDTMGSGLGARVLISSDGGEARAMLHDPTSPARWAVCAILDPAPATHSPKEAQA